MSTRPRRLRLTVVSVPGVVAVYGLVGAVVIPPIAKHLVEKNLTERLGRAAQESSSAKLSRVDFALR